jgi:integrase/recombinase XerD
VHCSERGIKSSVFIHKFRRGYATHLTWSGVQRQPIKELTSHSSIITTEIYTHNNLELILEEDSVHNNPLE